MAETKILSQELAFKGRHVQVRLDRIIDYRGKHIHDGNRRAPGRGLRRASA